VRFLQRAGCIVCPRLSLWTLTQTRINVTTPFNVLVRVVSRACAAGSRYYDARQVEAFGGNAMFVPLGSRVEFPDITDAQIMPASDRKLVYALMMALTDNSRVRLRDAFKLATSIPEARTFVHIAEQWVSAA
jgi:hypothetical protein